MSNSVIPRQWNLCQTTNNTDASAFDAIADTATKPTATATRCIINVNGATTLRLRPFMVGNDNVTMALRVVGWAQISGYHWTADEIYEATATACTSTGIAASRPLNTERYADTITTVAGIGVVLSNSLQTPATVQVDVSAYELVEVEFHRNTSSSTSCNALYMLFA